MFLHIQKAEKKIWPMVFKETLKTKSYSFTIWWEYAEKYKKATDEFSVRLEKL